MFSLKGKTVVVTGGGRGLGRGISLCMAEAGANVVMTGRTRNVLETTDQDIRALGAKTLVIPGDITNPEHIDEIVEKTISTFGYIDCWVNNAGSANADDVAPLIDITPEQWDNVVDLNMKWAFFAAQAAARSMTRGGSIINISSRSGSQPNPNTGQYGAAKAGLENLTQTMAVEWGHKDIRINAVAPGVVPVENSSGWGRAGRLRRQLETVPLRRLGKPEDIGAICVFFAADESAWISGETVQVTGGSRITVGTLTYLWRVNKDFRDLDAEAEAIAAEHHRISRR